MEIKPIETIYNGYRFRSRLEARWAVFFDELGVQYEYEPEGFEMSDGTRYLPDFYLPESKSWFEVKGLMDDFSLHKIDQFVKAGNYITIGYPGFEFNAMDIWCPKSPPEFAGSENSWLCKCFKCGHKYFMGRNGIWACPCCGEYDGDSHFTVLADGRRGSSFSNTSDEFERAANAAKRARFEHGETPRR